MIQKLKLAFWNVCIYVLLAVWHSNYRCPDWVDKFAP